MVLLGVGNAIGIRPAFAYPLRSASALAVLVFCSRGLIKLRPSVPLASVLLGLGVFAVWIGPDLIWPGYRNHWLFANLLTGGAAPARTQEHSAVFLFARVSGSALLVPIVEELFWRAWLMRWLVSPHFQKVPLGTYSTLAFWATAILFASEHGAFWGVGLAAGIAYNWWMIRTRSLADCTLAHGVTNGALAAYVLLTDGWEYWL
jgi:CAAX prenyl protease-like protein